MRKKYLYENEVKDLCILFVCFCSGVKGVVMDSYGKPVQNAVVAVEGRRNLCPLRTDRNGEYYRLLLPGNYTINVRSGLLVGNFIAAQIVKESSI